MKRPFIFLLIVFPALVFHGMSPNPDLPYRGEGKHLMLNECCLEWIDIASMAAPARIDVIEGDLSQPGPFTFRLKLPDGYEIRPHVHPAYERLTVLAGTLHFAHGKVFDKSQTMAIRPGGVAVMPPGDSMFGYAKGDVIMQLHGTGPWGIEYIDPADDPRN